MKTITVRIYGAEGHRQRESFNESQKYDFSRDGDIRIIEIRNADITGTHDYTEVAITRNTEAECWEELNGQISDGIFENSRTGIIEIVTEKVDSFWYAVQTDVEDDWGTGSFDLDEAKKMARQYVKWGYSDTLIAVIDNNVCVEEIRDFSE